MVPGVLGFDFLSGGFGLSRMYRIFGIFGVFHSSVCDFSVSRKLCEHISSSRESHRLVIPGYKLQKNGATIKLNRFDDYPWDKLSTTLTKLGSVDTNRKEALASKLGEPASQVFNSDVTSCILVRYRLDGILQ